MWLENGKIIFIDTKLSDKFFDQQKSMKFIYWSQKITSKTDPNNLITQRSDKETYFLKKFWFILQFKGT